jgi:hypothetical protein
MTTTANSPVAAQPPARAVRVIVSLLVSVHVLAVFVGPWAMPPQGSELAYSCARVLQPYVDALYLANGYRFFAPEPGPSHLVRCEVTLDDGSLVSFVFPDRQQHVPRLLYHRYFMLSEFINTLDSPNAPRDRAEAVAQGYAQHLADEYHARSVRLYLRRHYVPRTSEVRQGMRLSDKSLYEERPLVVYTRDES